MSVIFGCIDFEAFGLDVLALPISAGIVFYDPQQQQIYNPSEWMIEWGNAMAQKPDRWDMPTSGIDWWRDIASKDPEAADTLYRNDRHTVEQVAYALHAAQYEWVKAGWRVVMMYQGKDYDLPKLREMYRLIDQKDPVHYRDHLCMRDLWNSWENLCPNPEPHAEWFEQASSRHHRALDDACWTISRFAKLMVNHPEAMARWTT
ncbi:MAG: 3'-5' exoribonuclease [Pseudomonadota bacterium]